MKRFCVSQQDAIDFLCDNGFTEEDGKLYLTADTAKASYLTVSFTPGSSSNITYHGSDGASYVLVTASTTLLMLDVYELKYGGVGMRYRMVNSTADGPNTPLNFAAISKTDQSGFEYYFVNAGTIKHDALHSLIVTNAFWQVSNASQTSTIAALAPLYDDANGFADVCAKSILLTQSVTTYTLYNFDCGGKKYLAMLTSLATSISGGIAFEVD